VNPAHHLRVRAHIRRHDVAVGPNLAVNALDEFSGQDLQLARRKFARIAAYAALAAAKRNIDKCRLHRH